MSIQFRGLGAADLAFAHTADDDRAVGLLSCVYGWAALR
jgi:hypothetical protein